MRVVLKFCYLYLFLVSIACGGNDAKKTNDSEPKGEPKEEVKSDTDKKTILFFGNSLTAGMGLEVEEAFPALIQKKIDAAILPFEVINAGLSGETTASGKNRLAWLLKQKVDIFVLELGANDGLRGIALDETKKNLQNIIDEVRQHNPEVIIVLAGMQIPPNMGLEYTSGFREIFPNLAAENDLLLIPFLLKDVAGMAALNQQDGIHPTAEGQKIVANNVWEVLEKAL